MSSCFGCRRKGPALDDDQEPLLSRYRDETDLQRRLHQKLHSYQMFRAISQGYMPSNEQVIINLRTLLSSDILNPDQTAVSDSGRRLAKHTKTWLHQFVDLLQHKNNQDQIQDFIWCLAKSRMSLNTTHVSVTATKAKAKADSAAAYQSLRTVGSLLLANSDFRTFLSDLQSVGRDVFKDSAFALSRAAEDAGKQLEQIPSAPDMITDTVTEAEQNGVPQKRRGSDILKEALGEQTSKPGQAPTEADLTKDVKEVSKIVGQEVAVVGKEAQQSLSENISGDEKKALISRLQKAIMSLRQRPDYNSSVSILSLLIKRYAFVYSRAAEDVAGAVDEGLVENEEMDLAVARFWSLVRSFGEASEWNKLETCIQTLVEHQKRNPEFENLMIQIGNALQSFLTDPKSLEHADEKFNELRNQVIAAESDTSIRADVENLFSQISRTLYSVAKDKDILNLYETSLRVANILSPAQSLANQDLLQDTVNTFVPLMINAIQHIPIPRVEISTPEIDLLLENLIIEPGHTINRSSFLPFRFRAETYNDLEIRKTHTLSTVSHTTSLLTLKIDGLSMRAEEIGYWFRLKQGIFGFQDEGIASFALDSRGVDIAIDVEISRPSASLESILSLRAVRVKIHKLAFALRRSKFSWFAFLLKPLLKPVLKRTLEQQLAATIADFFHAANRELVFARERLRATRIADPADLATFVRAVAARLVPEDDPDLYARVGVDAPTGRKNVFRGVYAPGSVVKVWHEEARRAAEHVDDWRRDGWRNAIFDVNVEAAGNLAVA